MTNISAKRILASRHAQRPDLIQWSFLTRYPRWIHAEGRTHRALDLEEGLIIEPRTPSPMEDPNLSRNAGSSRAIPVAKMIADLRADPAVPIYWGANQKGMIAEHECNTPVRLPSSDPYGTPAMDRLMGGEDYTREEAWLWAMEQAITAAEAFEKAGYHKQMVNRLIEPFTHITVLYSGVSWSNFFELRIHGDAEPHIRMLAQAINKEMVDALNDPHGIQTLEPGQWHTPFIMEGEAERYGTEDLKLISSARCASTSYKTVDGFDMDPDRASALTKKLVASAPLHASPLEHVVQADEVVWHGDHEGWAHEDEHRNTEGFRQFRAQMGG